MWSALPISTSYSDPYLLIYTENSIDIYNIFSGIWLQSLPLTNTYPLTFDGSISLSQDPEFHKHYGKLISITGQNRLTPSLHVLEKTLSSKPTPTREGLFRSTLFGSTKSTQSSPDVSISEPTGFRHIEHLGRNDGLTILSQSSYDGRTSIIRPYLSEENRTITDSSFNPISDASFSSSDVISQ
jgi:hypothetical protein